MRFVNPEVENWEPFICNYNSSNIYTYEKSVECYNNLLESEGSLSCFSSMHADGLSPLLVGNNAFSCSVSSRQMNIRPQWLDGNKSNIVDGSTDSTSELSLNTGVACLTSAKDNPSSRRQQSDLAHRVSKLVFGSLSDFKSYNCGWAQQHTGEMMKQKESVSLQNENLHDIADVDSHIKNDTETAIKTVGKRMFWFCKHLGGKMTPFLSSIPVRSCDVQQYIILECNSMLGLPYRCEGCCIMLYDGVCWMFGVVVQFTEEFLLFQRMEAFTLQLVDSAIKIDVTTLSEKYVFKFVNVFSNDTHLLSRKFLHHCVVNKYDNVEGMLLPSIWRRKNTMLEYTSRKQHWRCIMKKKREAKHSLGKKKRTLHKNGRSNLHHTALGKTGEYWHTIYVKQDNKSLCNDICEKIKLKISCKRKKEKQSFYIIVTNPCLMLRRKIGYHLIVVSSTVTGCIL